MKKLIVLFIALLITGSAYGLNETATNGPQNITSCYIVGTGPLTSGNIVALQTTSPTYPGREVTLTSTRGEHIYGIIVDTDNKTVEDVVPGIYVRVLTYGYYDAIRVNTVSGYGAAAVAVGEGLVASDVVGVACSNEAPNGGTVTATAIALSTQSAAQASGTVEGFLNW